ncbi:hypothetical protein SERLA73DRAFT_72536 [Serpula lacrymans var. lacrymans S7.3]|uniref:Conserved oligomeric Golgi complex subunit 2 n=1 Tax=Serpula lacrymans var. lacrymans (strain S7.3) TaxID=936435 RepID=F8PUX6_SERL3|nr:hypothetical protein SERLA73DRAFT_72536 [Serpula lacrymans var. lacrymans S7.3]
MSLEFSGATSVERKDPFDLERLAEELATREKAYPLAHGTQASDDSHSDHDLPIYVPLSHDNPYLTAEPFDVDQFLLSRSYTSLPDLRSELRDYLSTLKEELVQLINDDYEAFISLSTDLKGEGARMERLRLPLNSIKSEILEVRKSLQTIQDTTQEKLDERAKIREEKEKSVTRLESLLLISQPMADETSSSELTTSKLPTHLSNVEHVKSDIRTQSNRAKHLARVAAEYTQLLYHTAKARAEKCEFVDEIQWRIDRVQSTLSSDLDHIFASTLVALTDINETKKSDIERAKLMVDLTECLRIYDTLSLWRDAEEILRKEVVRGFVRKTIYPGALNASHSPIIPHTPLPAPSTHRASVPLTASFPLRTPYTPFTAFATKQNPFETSYGSSVPSMHLLDESDDSLARLYNQLLRFVERDLSYIMEIAEKASLNSASRARDKTASIALSGMNNKEQAKDDGFNIIANVIWAEFGKALLDELGSVIFSVGNPDEFRKHYETTEAFLRSLEFLAPSTYCIEAMRLHPIFVNFKRRWQLPVYFQLRWKDIIGKLEDSLLTTTVELKNERFVKVQHPFATTQAASIWTAIATCWSAEVYIPDLSHRFWKLTLQVEPFLLSRYKTWLDSSLPSFEAPPKVVAAFAGDKSSAPSSLSRASTPVPPMTDSVSVENSVADDLLLRQFSAVILDIKIMSSQMLALWRDEISIMLPHSVNAEGNEGISSEVALEHQLSALEAFLTPLTNQIVSILTRRSCDALVPVRSIPSQFRAMSNKRLPVESSYFVTSILRPVKDFFGIGSNGGPGDRLKKDSLKPIATDVFDVTCQRYNYYLTAMKKTEESLKRLKKGKKATFSLFSSASAGKDDDGRDEERIRTQMILDVEAFAKDGESMGVDVHSLESFKSLDDLVHSGLIDARALLSSLIILS